MPKRHARSTRWRRRWASLLARSRTTFQLTRPTDDQVRRWLAAQESAPVSYAEVGATRATPPPGFTLTHHRVYLGDGAATFARAQEAVRRWAMFEPSWITVFPAAAPIRVGSTVALLVRYLGVWSLNACRIVYVVDERGKIDRFGFAYGTLPAHGVQGEERFSVEWNHDDDAVTYDVLAVSRPGSVLSWLGLPLMRRLQRRFARDSKRAMLWTVQR